MAIAKGKSGNALGLTSGKTRSSSLARGKGKPLSKQVENDLKTVPKKESDPSSTQDRVIPKWLSKLAEGKPELDVHAEKYDSLWEATERKIGRAAGRYSYLTNAVHGENVNRIDRILRVFDLDADYGPCTGMTRLERWERARDIGADPPAEIADILNTKQGILDFRWSILERDLI